MHKKNLYSFILTQLDDGSHLEFYHVGFRHCHLGFRHLLIFSQIYWKTLSLHSDSWLKLIQSDANSFILTQLDDCSHLEFCHLGFSHLSFSSQTHSHLPGLVPIICTKKTSLTLPSPPFAQKILHSFILTQLDDGSHFEFYYVGFRPCHLGFRHLLIFSQIHSKTLSLHSASWLKLIQSDANSFILTQLDDGSHLEFCHLEFGHLGFSHLSFPSQTHSHLPRLFPTICTKKPSLIHSDSTWWWQPSWILPCWIKKTSLIHSDWTWWWQSSWIVPCWIQTPCFLLSDSLKNTLTPLWLWLKLIQSDSNSFILTQLDDGSHLEFDHLWFSHLSFSSQTHSHLPGLVPTICTKKNLHSFILTQLDDGSHLEFYHVGFRHLVFFFSDSLKNTLTPLWLWLKLIQSDSNLFILTQLDDGSHLEFCQLQFGHLGFSHLSFSSQTHSHLPRLVPTICTKKIFTHSFWLNLMMAAILNSTMLDSDTAILDSDTFLSSLRFTQKHSLPTLTLDSN